MSGKVVKKAVKKPVKPTRSLGEYLLAKADKMRRKGNLGPEYKKVRETAEWHLRMWSWQRDPRLPSWKLPGQIEDFTATACQKAGCPYLPAGSSECRSCDECP